MNKFVTTYFSNTLPEPVKKIIRPVYNRFTKSYRKSICEKKELLNYYSKRIKSNEINELCNHISKHGMSTYPYDWFNINDASNIVVNYDDKLSLPYVLLDNNRLYYPREMAIPNIQADYYLFQVTEQENKLCPHKYITSEFNISKEDIVVDGGGSCGNFSLSIIENVKKIYLFEPNPIWIEPLMATFKKYGDKIDIIPKFLSDCVNDITITIDEYCNGKELPTFIKLDIEGFEEKALIGAKKSISSGNVRKIVACVYHNQDDEKNLRAFLDEYNFNISLSKGFITVHLDEFQPPYFRNVLIRCEKINQN